MFGSKKTNITNQIGLKEELVKQLDVRIYKLSRTKFETKEENDRIFAISKKLTRSKEQLEETVGGINSDITVGVEKTTNCLSALDNALKGNYVGRIADAAEDIMDCVDEIVDYMNGVTPIIEEDDTSEHAIIRKLEKAYDKISETGDYLNKKRNSYMENVNKCQRDKEELEARMLKAQSQERIDSIYDEIMGVDRMITMYSQQASLFSSNLTAITNIKSYFRTLINNAPLSKISIKKMSFLSKIKELDYVLDNPDKIGRILNMIAEEMQNTQKEIDKMKENMQSMGLTRDSSAANAYLEKLKQKKMEENMVEGTASILEETNTKDTEEI